jgi:GNAT superfamily N-acetyltransferase
MSTSTQTQADILRDMGDGIILRRLTEADLEPLLAMQREIFDDGAAAGTIAVIEGYKPIGRREDFVVAVDTTTGEIVSSIGLLQKTLTYEGIPFGIGMPEWVLTRPAYRRKGLIRAQMDVMHQWSAERGDLMQLIGGIPNYYRQFGYDMALELGMGRVGFKSYVPKLKEGETEAYRVRPATQEDVPFINDVTAYARQRYAITNLADETYWAGAVRHAATDDPWRSIVCIIETAEGEAVGYCLHGATLRSDHQLGVYHLELKPGQSWLAIALPLTRYLCATGEEYAQRDNKEFGTFLYWLGTDHPIYEVMEELLPRVFAPYAWYVRIPDLAGFLRHIAPALETRLAHSVVVGHTGQLRLNFYRSGLRLVFAAGKLTTIEPWQAQPGEGADNRGDASFPELTFYQLLLGYRTLEELEQVPDCTRPGGDAARALLHALFPRRVSDVWQ